MFRLHPHKMFGLNVLILGYQMWTVGKMKRNKLETMEMRILHLQYYITNFIF